MNELPNNFTPRAQQVLALARKEAHERKLPMIQVECLFLGIIRLSQGVAYNVLFNRYDLVAEEIKKQVDRTILRGTVETVGSIPYTGQIKKILAVATREARALGHTYIGTEHLLLGIIHETDCVPTKILKEYGVTEDDARDKVRDELEPSWREQKPEISDGEIEQWTCAIYISVRIGQIDDQGGILTQVFTLLYNDHYYDVEVPYRKSLANATKVTKSLAKKIAVPAKIFTKPN